MIARVRKALVLGAGLGTRLLPLTNVLPKPFLCCFFGFANVLLVIDIIGDDVDNHAHM